MQIEYIFHLLSVFLTEICVEQIYLSNFNSNWSLNIAKRGVHFYAVICFEIVVISFCDINLYWRDKKLIIFVWYAIKDISTIAIRCFKGPIYQI